MKITVNDGKVEMELRDEVDVGELVAAIGDALKVAHRVANTVIIFADVVHNEEGEVLGQLHLRIGKK